VFSQVKFTGWWQSNLYVWESLNENQYWNYYQGLQFRVGPATNVNTYLNTYFRVAYRADLAKWEERVHNLYYNQNFGKNYSFRLGRQFIYHGVINGTMDALKLSGRLGKSLRVHLLGGVEAPYNRELKIQQSDKGTVLGAYALYRFKVRNSIDVSYVHKERNSELFWQQVGTTILGYFSEHFYYYARVDYNLLKDSYQTLRGRLTYYQNQWSVTAEYNSMKPRIFEDSFFNIFVINPYNQIRAAFDYKIASFNLGIQLLHTVYNAADYYILFKDDKDFRILGTIGHNRYGSFGLIYQTGYAVDNFGYFADLRYDFLSNLSIRFFNSYYNYERATINIGQDALSFMGGLSYKFNRTLIIDGEVQQSINNIYKDDVRGLFRLTYLFGY
jgi:hypothetical protein